ncbi:hypothetical protein PYCC9005_002504 [Savitreella phatthalungensis]
MTSGDPRKAGAEGLVGGDVGRYKVVVRRRSFWETMRLSGRQANRRYPHEDMPIDIPAQSTRMRNDSSASHSTLGYGSTWSSTEQPHTTGGIPPADHLAAAADEETWLLTGSLLEPRRALVERTLASWTKRMLVFYILPAAIVLAYAAIPFPLYDDESRRSGVVTTNFWFFLLIFYGFYNAVGLLWITKLFNLFAINWWPRSLGGPLAFGLFWAVSLAVGSLTYVFKDDWGTWTLTWSLLTLCTLAMPVFFGFFHVRRAHNDRVRASVISRHASGSTATNSYPSLISALNVFDSARLPRSYKRFLWFVLLLAIGLGSFALGEAYAYLWLSTLPHGPADTLLYVYTWVGVIYTLDFVTGLVVDRYIDSYPLLFMFKLYYALTHQIYVRNLYARMHTPEQFALLQGASSLLTVVVTPVVMHGWTHYIASQLSYSPVSLSTWRRNAARSFYVKSWAANFTMIAFLGWCTILYLGPNRRAYPYFDFDSPLPTPITTTSTSIDWDRLRRPGSWKPTTGDDLFRLTIGASVCVWLCEGVSRWLAKLVLRAMYGVRPERELRRDLRRFPDLLPASVVLLVFVAINMLMATVRVAFH